MEQTVFISQLIGVYAIVLGLSMIAKRRMLMGIFHEISENRALTYVMGAIMVILGLLLVRYHSYWSGLETVFITVIGWGVLIEGALYLFLSKSAMKKMLAVLHGKKVYYTVAFIYLALGVYLAYFGFTPATL